uniref:Uncharacterized protein n=1 Tax=Anguilla anguilla TaxID=7936 RepID=A0A0E9VKR3_ANGAN
MSDINLQFYRQCLYGNTCSPQHL